MNLLLLRGLTREARHWGDFPKQIESQLPGVKVHCIDLPGVGTENSLESPNSIRAIRNDVRKRWLSQSAQGKWSVLALSMGGMVAIDWLKEFPSDFQTAILINTSARNLSRWHQRLSLTAALTVGALILKTNPMRRENTVLKIISEKHKNDQNLVQQFGTIAQDRPLARKTVLRQLFAASKFSAPKFDAKVPLYFLASRKDKIVNWRCVRELAQHYSAPFYIHEEAGHDLVLDDPNWVIEKMKQIL
jgi:pimeloyl-ACP methyl ester carboxylesterase